MSEMELAIGTKIKRVRELRNFSQEHMAQRLSMSQQAYSKLENNETKVSTERLQEIAAILGVEAAALLNMSDTYIFQQVTQSQIGTGQVHIKADDLFNKDLYERQLQELKETITHLREENIRLLSLLEKSVPKSK